MILCPADGELVARPFSLQEVKDRCCSWVSAKALFSCLHIFDEDFDNNLWGWEEFNLNLPQLKGAIPKGLL